MATIDKSVFSQRRTKGFICPSLNKEYSQKYKVAVHSYILMISHVHLLLTPEEGNGVNRLIQSLGRYYVRYVNQTYGRSGTLWEGRYKSERNTRRNQAWVLGDDRFKKQIEKQAGRGASPMMREGDRKSEKYKADQLL